MMVPPPLEAADSRGQDGTSPQVFPGASETSASVSALYA